MPAAEPTDLQRLFIMVVMGIDGIGTADLTGRPFQLAGFQSSLDSEMGIVFGWVCPAPIRLACFALDHA